MPYVRIPGTDIVAHVKLAKRRQPKCSATCEHGGRCQRPGSIQCDYQVAHGKTCDAYICRAHATSVGPDVDHCPTHAQRQGGLFSGLLPEPISQRPAKPDSQDAGTTPGEEKP